MSIELPEAPALEPAETYAQRHAIWWQQCDVLLRQASHTNWAEMMAKVDAAFAPTAAAWMTFDGRLAALADALNAGQGGGFDKEFVKWLVSTVMRLPPETP